MNCVYRGYEMTTLLFVVDWGAADWGSPYHLSVESLCLYSQIALSEWFVYKKSPIVTGISQPFYL